MANKIVFMQVSHKDRRIEAELRHVDTDPLVPMGRFLCKILRHSPEIVGIRLDRHGWANVDELLRGVNRTKKLDLETLENIVATDDKQRYSFSADKSKIRANQGHSVHVDVELSEEEPPETLWHGTTLRFSDSIEANGLTCQSRLHVHMTESIPVAIASGLRRGQPVLYKIDTEAMKRDGIRFLRSANDVWLTEYVAPEYLIRYDVMLT